MEEAMKDRLPPMEMQAMNDAQRQAAEALIAGPRKAVVGPFIALLRSPELLDRMQSVGEYIRSKTRSRRSWWSSPS
jgi:4-carboxymuconolactone decarboxylase